MKKLILAVLVLTGALVNQANAVTYTNYLDDASNAIAQAYAATEDQPKPHALLGKALKALQKPSTSVAGDYNIFLGVASALLPLTGQPGTEVIGTTLSNAFTAFVQEAATQIGATAGELAAITDFQKQKRAASNNLWQAEQALLVPTMTTNIQLGILSVRLAFAKLAVAQKLTAKAASKQGFARDSVQGYVLGHEEKDGNEGTVTFTDGSNYTSTSTDGPGSGTYTYTRTGLSTATLVLNEAGGGTTTVNLKFSSATDGKFTYRFEEGEDSGSGSGTFTLNPQT